MNDPELNQSEIDALLADVSVDGPGDVGGDTGGGDLGGFDDAGSGGVDAGGAGDDDLAALLGDSSGGGDVGGGVDDFGGMDDLGGFDTPAPAAAPAAAAPPAPAAVPANVSGANLEALLDVPLEVVVELGRTDLQIKDILGLAPGSVVELNRMSGEPIDVLVNGKLVARGEVVVIDESFGIKILSIISPLERLTHLH
jgi:flagellar motor switch protein FliN/FliY